jgi:nicotinate-nucleotide adenylyltransferase
VIGLYGGAFDPPHAGHVEFVRAAKARFDLPRLVVLVAEHPGHKGVTLDAPTRLELARAAFPDEDVRLDPHERTIDMLRAEDWNDPLFLVGADQLRDLPTWKEPDAVLELARLAVATRPGFPRAGLQSVLDALARPERVLFFEIEPVPVASREIRERLAAGGLPGELVPPEVARLIRARGLYSSQGVATLRPQTPKEPGPI